MGTHCAIWGLLLVTGCVFGALSLAVPTGVPAQKRTPPLKKYVLVFDAGSTGTRVNVMSFRTDPDHSTGMRLIKHEYKAVKPGLSSFRHSPQRIRGHLKPLLEFASERIPREARGAVPVLLGATAGLRNLPIADQRHIMMNTRTVLTLWSESGGGGRRKSDKRGSRKNGGSTGTGAGGILVRILTGAEEAQFGWLAVNFLMDSLKSITPESTFGLLDMGGGSTQIVFLPELRPSHVEDPFEVKFRTLGGRTFELHQHSYPSLGLSQVILDLLKNNEENGEKLHVTPCLAANFSNTFEFGAIKIDAQGDMKITDAERYDQCLEQHEPLLMAASVHTPPLSPFTRFVAMAAYYYQAKVFNENWRAGHRVPANVTVGYFKIAAQHACRYPVDKGSYVPYSCIGLIHISNLLTNGYKFPPEHQIFLTDKIDGHSVGWPLGLAVHWLSNGSGFNEDGTYDSGNFSGSGNSESDGSQGGQIEISSGNVTGSNSGNLSNIGIESGSEKQNNDSSTLLDMKTQKGTGRSSEGITKVITGKDAESKSRDQQQQQLQSTSAVKPVSDFGSNPGSRMSLSLVATGSSLLLRLLIPVIRLPR